MVSQHMNSITHERIIYRMSIYPDREVALLSACCVGRDVSTTLSGEGGDPIHYHGAVCLTSGFGLDGGSGGEEH